MPVDPQASVRISAFKWVPPFAQGHVRDLRARWALEEAGVPYAVLERHPNLVAYKARCQARPAFAAALAAQLADFEQREAISA
jgi:hypothetical protein